MKNSTILGTDIPESTRGVLYLCELCRDHDNLALKVHANILFTNVFDALNAYANIPNPESQLVTGKDYNELIQRLYDLHYDMYDNIEWLKALAECI